MSGQPRVLTTLPPNFKEINAAFNVRGKPVIFAYGDTIHNPGGIKLAPHLMAHEKVHLSRQDGAPAAWWRRYIADPEFRLAEEIPAHAAEYRHFRATIPAGARLADILQTIAHRLASPLYGSMVGIDEAKRLIAHGEEGAAR